MSGFAPPPRTCARCPWGRAFFGSAVILTYSRTGWAKISLEQVEIELPEDVGEAVYVPEFLDLFTAKSVASKEHAPYLIPAVLRDLEGGRTTRSGKRSKRDALGGSVLAFDMDESPDLSPYLIEDAVQSLGVGGWLWQTWSSTEDSPRFRLVLPLEEVLAPKAWDELWVKVARALERALHTRLGHNNRIIGWQSKDITHPHLLPCQWNLSGTPLKIWGGVAPKIIGISGPAFPLDPKAQRAVLSGAWKEARRQERSQRPSTPRIELREPTPYVGNPEAPRVRETLSLMLDVGHRVPSLTDGLDAVAHLHLHGVETHKGGRRNTLYNQAWTLHRCGSKIEDIDHILAETLERSGAETSRYLQKEGLKILTQVEKMEGEAEERATSWAHRIHLADKTNNQVSSKTHRPAIIQYCRILARALHLYRPEGGQLDHEQIAKVVGVDVRIVTAWRGILREAGFVKETGEARARRYFLPAS